MKHIIRTLFLMAILTAGIVICLIVVRKPKISRGDPVYYSETESVIFYPIEPSEKGEYYIEVLGADTQKQAAVVLAAMRPFSMWVNGKQLYHYQKEAPYHRLHVIPLPQEGNSAQICIKSESGQHNLKMMLTALDRVEENIINAKLLSVLLIGIQLAILFVCGTLYSQKPTEKYLLAEMLAVITTLISAVLISGVIPLPVKEWQYVYIQYLVDSIRIPILQAVCILLIPLPNHPFFDGYRRHVKIVTVVASFLFLLLHLLRLNVLVSVLPKIFWLLTAFACANALVRHEPCMIVFTIGYLLRYGFNLYVSMTNEGILPNTSFLIYFYIPQLNNLLFILPCVYIVNYRFSAKYTQAEQLAAQLQETNRMLDQRVEQRTRELWEQQEKRRNMMVNIFHDLRSPIFAARGYVEMMLSRNHEDEEILSIVKSKLDFLSSLTEQLFLSAKLEENKVTFVKDRVDVTELCQHVCHEAESLFQEKSLNCELSLEKNLTVVGDGFRLKQVMENIVSNAISFTPVNGKIQITGRRTDEEVVLSIHDSGTGIEEEDLPYVFDRYYQGKNSNKQRSSGLGLFIASEIVKKHGGSISVQSEPENGTTFAIHLPYFKEAW